MNFRLTTCSLAVSAAFAVIPFSASAAPTIAFTAPAVGGALKGDVKGPPNCIVQGSDISHVMFYINGVWTNTDGNLDNGLGCWIDTTKFKDGPYTLKAVAYNSSGQTATATRDIRIANTVTPTPTPTPTPGAPTISFTAPAVGGALQGDVKGPPNCIVEGSNIDHVMFYINGVWTNTDGNLTNGLGCWIDTTKFKDGPYTLKAVAYNASGQTTTTERAIVIQNAAPTPTPTPTPGAPTISITAPAVGGKLTGNVQGPPNCIVEGSNIARVMFYLNGVWTNTDGNLTNGLGCWIDTTKYANGTYTLKAVAYSPTGQTATTERSIVIENSVASNTPPTVAFKAPTAGATLKGYVNSTTCEATATDNRKVAKVDFYVGKTMVNTKTAAPFQCAIDTTKFPDGEHTLMAVATDDQGASATTQRNVKIANTVVEEPAPGSGSLDSADIIGWASADIPFAEQRGYGTQVLGSYYMPAGSIPEAGIHGSTLSNGETLRLGKESDPLNSARKALSFQLSYSDPNTSGSKRSEITYSPNVEMNKVYWVAFRVYVRDWGNESSGGLFGTQLHSGDNSRGLSPSFGLYMIGARNYEFQTRYSTSGSPSQSNSITVRHAQQPIKFGQWMDVVIKFKHNTSGNGFLQAWTDGNLIVDYKGNLGFNTPGYKDYFKFGLYNWSSFNTPRKVMLRAPTMVLDPTGSKYDAATLRAHIRK